MWPTLAADLPIRTWSLLVTLGVLLCWLLFMRRATRLGHPRTRTFLWLLTAFPVGAISAALGAGLVRLALGRADSLTIGDASTGMTVLGAVAGCLFYSMFYARRILRTPALPLLDAAAFTYPLALVFGRIGCLFNGCCFGETTTLPFPLSVPLSAYAPTTLAATHHHAAPTDAMLVNLPILLAFAGLVTLIATETFWRRRVALGLRPGTVIVAALAVDAALRFVIEFARPDPSPWLNPWQTWTLVVLVAASATLFVLWRRRTPPLDGVATP